MTASRGGPTGFHPSQASPRDRLLDAAAQLFSRDGVSIGVEALCRTAGVSKRSMYQLFDRKDEMPAASLERRIPWYEAQLAPADPDSVTPRERILYVFEQVEKASVDPGCFGCPYLAVLVELKDSEHPVSEVARAVKEALEEAFRTQTDLGGARDPELLARRLMLPRKVHHNAPPPSRARCNGGVTAPPDDCLARNEWVCGAYLSTRREVLLDAVGQHLQLTASAVLIGLALALPLAVLARRWALAAGPVLAVTTVLYTIPSLAMFSLLLPLYGLSATLVVAGLVLYSLTVLVRNILAGLRAVPRETRQAARGLGYGPIRLLLTVELPLALPAAMAGLRIATVSAVSLVTVGAIVGFGGLGNLIYAGMNTYFKAQVLTASVLCVLIAVAADLLLLGVQWLITPWARAARA
ncbi:hypothetical protein Scel_19380 [Streptomyces cellostaticus]|nr:hypothetical protein Scel_19380 [Streptomyces cellostaticus]